MCDHWEKKAQAWLGSSMHIYIYRICLDDSETFQETEIMHTIINCIINYYWYICV